MGSALIDTTTLDPALSQAATHTHASATHPSGNAATPASAQELRLQIVERLAAHRTRRIGAQAQTQTRPAVSVGHSASPSLPSSRHATTRSARIAAAVAERYAHSPSYRAFLAAEAERAVQQAQAAAEVAALNAQAVAEAQQQLLDAMDQAALDQAALNQAALNQAARGEETQRQAALDEQHVHEFDAPAQDSLPPSRDLSCPPQPSQAAAPSVPRPTPPASPSFPSIPAAGITVRLYEDATRTALPGRAHHPIRASLGSSSVASGHRHGHRHRHEDRNDAEALALDEEIAFRQSPFFEEPAGPPLPLPANLIEFPRHLVAPRKARPRYAEGPLREDSGNAPAGSQLRIFEVDAAQISTTPEPGDITTPQWTSIWLDAPSLAHLPADPASPNPPGEHADSLPEPHISPVPFPEAAPISRRLFAAAINGAIILAAFLGFAATFIRTSAQPIPWPSGVPLHIRLASAASSIAAQTGLEPGAALAACAGTLAFFYLLYQALFFSFSDVTPGMRCARIALCTFADENPTRSAIRRRVVATLLSACPLGLGFLWALLDEDRLTCHDRISRMYHRTY